MPIKAPIKPKHLRIVTHNGKAKEVIIPIKEYEAMQQLIEDLEDSLEIARAKNEIKLGKDELLPYKQVRSRLKAKGKL